MSQRRNLGLLLLVLCWFSWPAPSKQQQLAQPVWSSGAEQSQLVREPIPADLQNQVSALSAQIAAANRQLQYFQQQLALVAQAAGPVQSRATLLAGQQEPQLSGLPVQAPRPIQQAPQPQEPAPRVSTLVEDQPELLREPQQPTVRQVARFFYPPSRRDPMPQPQQAAQPEQPPVAPPVAPAQPLFDDQAEPGQPEGQSEPAEPTQSPVPTGAVPSQMRTPASHAPVHSAPRNDDKFAIGLGVLSPGYTQKFGNTALDFNQDKHGFSFTLSNNGHSNQVPQIPGSRASTR